MRYADTDTLRSLNERAAEDGLMWVAESFFEDAAPGGVHLCSWATPFWAAEMRLAPSAAFFGN